jgi:hypothetical protein
MSCHIARVISHMVGAGISGPADLLNTRRIAAEGARIKPRCSVNGQGALVEIVGAIRLYRWNMGAKTTCLLLSPRTEGYDCIRFSAEP